LIWVSGTAAIDPASGGLVGGDAYAQTRQIISLLRVMLEAAGSDLGHVTHVNVYLRRIEDFGEMNRAYAEGFGGHRPARTAVAVDGLPKAGALLTMSLVAVVRESA
jgi:2-iminobutanoate/2-iminopropanoate deaminase